jgi:hypothetical protein
LALNLALGAYGRWDSLPDAVNPSRTARDKQFGLVGWDALSSVIYQPPARVPVYVMLGYRYERIESEEGYPPIRREELSGVVLSFGLRRFVRKPPSGKTPDPAPD